MKKQWLLNLFLLGLAIALAAFIFFSEEKPDSRQLPRLTDIDPGTIRQISISHNGHSTQLEKHNGSWRISKPLQIAANDFRVKTILQLLNAPVHRTFKPAELDTEKIGLADDMTADNTRIRFDHSEIIFGIVNPATGLRYVRMGDGIYTIEDVYSPLLTSHFGTLVSMHLLPQDGVIEKLKLPQLSVYRDTDSNWQSSPPVSKETIENLIDSWRYAQAFGIHAYMPRKQLGEISIEFSNHPPLHFIISDTEPWFILARPDTGLEYHLEKETGERLLQPEQ